MVVLSYRSVLPGEISQKWKAAYQWSMSQELQGVEVTKGNVDMDVNRNAWMAWYWMSCMYAAIRGVMMSITLLLVYVIAFVPYDLQRALFQFVQPFIFWMFSLPTCVEALRC